MPGMAFKQHSPHFCMQRYINYVYREILAHMEQSALNYGRRAGHLYAPFSIGRNKKNFLYENLWYADRRQTHIII